MPIVTIQLIGSDEEDVPGEKVQAIADELGHLFQSGPGETWVRLFCLPRSQYAENDTGVGSDVRPTFVEVLKGSLPEEEALADEAACIAEIVSRQLARPQENTHVLYLPPGVGRIAFGGTLVRA